MNQELENLDKLVTIGKSQINVGIGVGGKGVDSQFNRQLPNNH